MATKDRNDASDRGKRAGFDPESGEVFGSGAGTGGNPDADEDYDSDLNRETGGRPDGSRKPAR